MLIRILRAVIIAVVVGLACILLGVVLESINVPPAEAVGGFLTTYAWAIGILAGLWAFLGGDSIFGGV